MTARAIRRPLLLAWSGGKDCMLVLDRLRYDARWRVVGLLSTVSAQERVHAHFTRVPLLVSQAAALQLPLYLARSADDAAADSYDRAFSTALSGRSRRPPGRGAYRLR